MLKRFYSLTLVLLASIMMAWADSEATYYPTQEVCFRTGNGNTAWNSGYPKSAADEGNTQFECNYFNGLFALQKYTVADLQNATKLVLTLYQAPGSGTDAIRVWSFPNNDWTADSGVDDMVNYATQAVGIAPRTSEGTLNTPLVTKGTWGSSDLNPRPATFTISGTALATVKANASSDGTFTLMLTDGNLTSASNRKYLTSNSANGDGVPTLTATIAAATPKTAKIGSTEYETLADAFAAAVAADADAEIEVSADQKLTARLTWNKAHTLTITPTQDITIKGAPGMMWMLVNVNGGVLNIGSSSHKITFDGEGKAMTVDGAVLQRESNGLLNVTNVEFKDFDLGEKARLCGDKQQSGVMTLNGITITNCSNPKGGYIYAIRVANDALVLKGYVNIDAASTGTAIYKQANLSGSDTEGRMKVDDDSFTASKVLTVKWVGLDDKDVYVEGRPVVVGVTSDAIAGCFTLTDTDWTLTRKNSDLVLTAPVTPTAKIGDTQYADLATAIAAAQDGDIITLLDDQEISARVNIQDKDITIDGDGHTVKRATSYANGLMFLTVKKSDDGKNASLTLKNMTIDGQDISSNAAVIEASNSGTTTLNNVTIQNVNTTANAAIVNKSGGKLVLEGNITVPSIFVGRGLVVKATGATFASAVKLVTDSGQGYALAVEDGTATDFTCETFRLSQQQDGIYLMPLAVAASYTHPALLHTAADITTAKGRLDQEPYKSAYAQLETMSAGTPAGASEYLKRLDAANWGPSGTKGQYDDYNNYAHAATDAKLAYELALRYQLKGSTAAATAAVNILNNWATTNKGFLRLKGYVNNIPDPNEYLMTIQAYQFANAAELLRDYSGWSTSDQTTFKNWIRQTFADVAILFLENHGGNSNALHYWLNWDLAAQNAMLSIGILCDDKALVDYALNYVDNGKGTGNKANAIVATHNDPDSEETLAQCQESGRDQGHSTLDVTLLGVLCQTAQNIGTDLWTSYKALEMAEYVGKYNLMDVTSGNFVYTADKVPFTTYTNGEETHTAISADDRGTVRPSWELFHAYAKKNSKADAYTEAWVKYQREKNAWGEAEGTSTDELGFGTLMYGAEITYSAITVTVKNTSRQYGEINPAFEYEISGGTAEQLGGTIELTCEATATSGVGEYAIKAAKGAATYPNQR